MMLLEIVTLVRDEQSWKTYIPTLLMLLGMVTLLSFEQYWKE